MQNAKFEKHVILTNDVVLLGRTDVWARLEFAELQQLQAFWQK